MQTARCHAGQQLVRRTAPASRFARAPRLIRSRSYNGSLARSRAQFSALCRGRIPCVYLLVFLFLPFLPRNSENRRWRACQHQRARRGPVPFSKAGSCASALLFLLSLTRCQYCLDNYFSKTLCHQVTLLIYLQKVEFVAVLNYEIVEFDSSFLATLGDNRMNSSINLSKTKLSPYYLVFRGEIVRVL